MKKLISLAFVVLIVANAAFAQRFAREIAEFQKKDSLNVQKGAILFIGSSSFTFWGEVQKDFPNHVVTNRAFGGSTLYDQINYVDKIVYPHAPRQVVIYCGENDIAESDTVTGRVVYDRFVTLFTAIRQRFPGVHIAYVSMKPSPSRQMMLPRMQEGNRLIKAFLKKKKRTAYINVYDEMVNDEGKPRPELFREDNLHMNRDGYVIWQRVIAPYLVKK